MVLKCPKCGGKLRSLFYFKNTKDEKRWIKAGYYCEECGAVYQLGDPEVIEYNRKLVLEKNKKE